MADASLRGRFELSAEQPIRQLHSIRDAGAEADAVLDRLGQRMDALSRKRITPRIELTGFDRVNAQLTELERRLDRLDRRRATPSVGMGGGFSNAAGGGGGLPFFSSLGGAAGRLPWWAMLAPLGPQLLGGAGALAGSAASATLGAGAIGTAAVGSLGLGAGFTSLIARDAVKDLGQITQAQQKYNDAVQAFGRHSTAAAAAKRQLDLALVATPQAAGAARQVGLLTSGFQSATRPGYAAVYSGISQSAYNLRRALPGVAPAINMAAGASAGALTSYSGFLTNQTSIRDYQLLIGSFAGVLPTIEHSAQNLTRTFENLAVAAIPFFQQGVVWIDHWTSRIERSTSNTQRLRVEMQGMVTSLRDWGRLFGAGGRLLRDVTMPGTAAGNSMVVGLTGTLDRLDVWVNRNPAKVRQFFTDAERGVSRIATVIGNLTGDVWHLFQAVSPILNRAEDFIRFASSLGGGSLLSGAGLLYGAYEGARGAVGRGPSAGGLFGSFLLGRGGPAARSMGGVGGGGLSPLAAVYGGVRGAGAAAAESTFLAPRSFMVGAGGETIATLATPEAFAGAYGGLRGARFAGAELVGERVGMFSRFGGVARGALAGAAKFMLPLAAISGLLTGINTGGGVPHAIGAGVSEAASQLTLGLVPRSTFQGVFHSAFGTTNAGASIGSAASQHEMQSIAHDASAVRTPADFAALRTRIQGVRLQYEMSPADAARLTAFLRHASAMAAQNAGAFASNQWSTAFQSALSRGTRPMKAIDTMLGGIGTQIRRLGPAGSRAMAGDVAQWAAQMQESDPTLRRPLDHLMAGIIRDLNNLHDHVRGKMRDIRDEVFFFNGQILTGTTTTWQSISKSLTDPVSVAQEKLLGIFGEIQQESINALVQMGFTQGEARQITTMTAAGGKAASGAAAVVGIAQAGNFQLTSRHDLAARHHARGGMIGGSGLLDTVALPDGSRAAPGEAWIANRHTMRKLDLAALSKYHKTAWQMIRDEDRPHSAPMYSLGGLMGGVGSSTTIPTPSVATMHPELHSGIAAAVAAVLSRFPSLGITSTTGGRHAAGSYHYLGEAADIAADPGTMFRAAEWIKASGLAGSLTEGIHNPNLAVHYGRIQAPPGDFSGVWAGHANHIHMAVAGLLRSGFAGGGGMGGGFAQSLSLAAPRSGLRGVPGALADRASQVYALGLQSQLNARLAQTPAIAGGGGGMTANEQLGHRMMLAQGWPESEWPSLLALWSKESGWNQNAVNPTSGAAGIPQDITGNMHGGAPGQIMWGLNYIRGRYGSPSAAWAHERQYNWYSRGGRVNWAGWHRAGGDFLTHGPTVFGAGEGGRRERVSIKPATGGRGGGHVIVVKFENVNLSAQPHEIEMIGRQVAGKILDALDSVDQGASDAELMAGASS